MSGSDGVWGAPHGSPSFNQKRLDFGLDSLPAKLSEALAGQLSDADEAMLLRQQLAAKEEEINRMAKTVSEKDRQIAFLSAQLAAMNARNSNSDDARSQH